MPEVLDWHRTADSRNAVERAVRGLTEGKIVALPTETTYILAASALKSEVVERLWQTERLPREGSVSIAVRAAAEALDFVPGMSALGRRLARRCWPGPVKLIFGDSHAGVAERFSSAVRDRLCPRGALALQSPAHEAVVRVLRLLPGPLVMTRAGSGEALTAAQLAAEAGEQVDLIVDAGPCPMTGRPSVVEVDGSNWVVRHEGMVSRAELERRSATLIIFVCTGNTCRSPLAEALCKKQLADRLRCSPDDLSERGFVVLSAGLAAVGGAAAAPEAVAAAAEWGADLSRHCSNALTADLASEADYLVVMTRGHRLALSGQPPHRGPRPRLLSPEGQDVPDPIGYDQETYRDCARQIWSHLELLVAELVP